MGEGVSLPQRGVPGASHRSSGSLVISVPFSREHSFYGFPVGHSLVISDHFARELGLSQVFSLISISLPRELVSPCERKSSICSQVVSAVETNLANGSEFLPSLFADPVLYEGKGIESGSPNVSSLGDGHGKLISGHLGPWSTGSEFGEKARSWPYIRESDLIGSYFSEAGTSQESKPMFGSHGLFTAAIKAQDRVPVEYLRPHKGVKATPATMTSSDLEIPAPLAGGPDLVGCNRGGLSRDSSDTEKATTTVCGGQTVPADGSSVKIMVLKVGLQGPYLMVGGIGAPMGGWWFGYHIRQLLGTTRQVAGDGVTVRLSTTIAGYISNGCLVQSFSGTSVICWSEPGSLDPVIGRNCGRFEGSESRGSDLVEREGRRSLMSMVTLSSEAGGPTAGATPSIPTVGSGRCLRKTIMMVFRPAGLLVGPFLSTFLMLLILTLRPLWSDLVTYGLDASSDPMRPYERPVCYGKCQNSGLQFGWIKACVHRKSRIASKRSWVQPKTRLYATLVGVRIRERCRLIDHLEE